MVIGMAARLLVGIIVATMPIGIIMLARVGLATVVWSEGG
jgi:hypothetical protein